MNKVAKKSVGRSKSVKKRSSVSASASKPAKKRLTARSAAAAAKPAKKRSAARVSAAAAEPASYEMAPRGVPLAEVTLLAAKAINMIAAKRSLSEAEKARKLANVAESLEHASKTGRLSKDGAWSLANPFGVGMVVNDWKAVRK